MLALALATLLLAAGPAAPGLRVTAMDDAPWQALVPEAAKGPEVAAVVSGETLSQTLLRLPKDAVLPSGLHPTDSTLVLLDGELNVEAGGKVHKLVQGSVLQLPAGTTYKGRTAWDRKALVLVTLAGPWSRAPE